MFEGCTLLTTSLTLIKHVPSYSCRCCDKLRDVEDSGNLRRGPPNIDENIDSNHKKGISVEIGRRRNWCDLTAIGNKIRHDAIAWRLETPLTRTKLYKIDKIISLR